MYNVRRGSSRGGVEAPDGNQHFQFEAPDGITLVAAAAESWTHYDSSSDDGSMGPPMDDSNGMPSSDEDDDDDDDGGVSRGDVRCDVRGDASDGGVCARGSSKKMRLA